LQPSLLEPALAVAADLSVHLVLALKSRTAIFTTVMKIEKVTQLTSNWPTLFELIIPWLRIPEFSVV